MPSPERRPRGRHVRAPWRPGSFGGVIGTVLLSAVLPGSAQLAAGRKALGRTALTVWILLLLGGLGFIAYVLTTGDATMAYRIAADAQLLNVVRIGAIVLGAVWLILLLDAWRTTRPLAWPTGQRLVSALTTVVIAVAGVVPISVAAQYAGATRGVVTGVFQEKPDDQSFTAKARKERPDGRMNILLLGGDGGRDRKGVRTDSMQVVSVDRRSGRAILVALPRSLQHAQFPAGSPMAARFPNGFDDLLTNIYPYGQDHPDLFPGASNPGAEAIMQAAGEITGLHIDRYVLVNLAGFRDVVDAIGGIDMYVSERVPIGGELYPDGRVKVPPSGWIEPGAHHLDGFHALWYARGRFNSDDYSRMRRQRCVMGAILDQANPKDVLLRYQRIANSTKNLVSTNISQSELPELVDVAADTRKHKIVSVTLTRNLINTVHPDFTQTRKLVREALTESEHPGASTIPTGEPTPTTTSGSTGSTATGSTGSTGSASTPQASSTETPKPVDATGDLDSVCRYR
jgi:LCP family protein required for cell wall assembly